MRGLVLDLRDNPGGLLPAAVGICDMFDSRSGVIVSTRGRDQQILEVWQASGKGPFTGFPMAVLVNHESASASEIVAACLQDHHRAVIVGQRTCGKGTVQEVTDLGDRRGELKLTMASYWRPSGENIHRRHDAGPAGRLGRAPDEGCEVERGRRGVEATGSLAAGSRRFSSRGRFAQRAPATAKPAAAPPVDRQLAKAVAYVEGEAAKQR